MSEGALMFFLVSWIDKRKKSFLKGLPRIDEERVTTSEKMYEYVMDLEQHHLQNMMQAKEMILRLHGIKNKYDSMKDVDTQHSDTKQSFC